MIIRSQDKKRIANIDTCNLIAIVGTQGKSKNITVDGMIIGEYSTEEKAIKVLDIICEAYCRMEDVKCGAVQAQKQDSFCFNMPSDEEVEV